MTAPSGRSKRRDAARDARQQRTRSQKKVGAFRSRLEEAEALAKVLVRKHGLHLPEARRLVFTAAPLHEMLSKRGQPPSGYELYESVEGIRDANGGKLPTDGGAPFWRGFTKQWNAIHDVPLDWAAHEGGQGEAHHERMFVKPDGAPDWQTVESVYVMTKKRLESTAAAILAKAKSKP
jgi:hypothetical protein